MSGVDLFGIVLGTFCPQEVELLRFSHADNRTVLD